MLPRSISKLIVCTLIAAIAMPVVAFGYASPGKPAGYVSDFAGVLTAATRTALESKLAAFEKQTGDEIAVVTVRSLGGDTIENYAVQLFQEWEIGKKGKDNGILILVAPTEHEARIEVGYGLEGTVTDLQSGNIIRNVMIPAFRQDDYAGGVTGGVDALIGIIGGSPDAAQYSVPASGSAQADETRLNINWGSLFVAIILFLNIIGAVLGRTKSWWLGGVLGGLAGVVVGLIWGFLYAGVISIPILIVLGLIFDFVVSRHGPRGPGGRPPFWIGGFGGRGGLGGGSGGFGGFGGGMSGGGGASGRW